MKPLSITSTTPSINNRQYAEYFGVMPVQGNNIELSFSQRDANRPFLTENHNMWQFFEPELRKRLKDVQTDETFASRVQSSLYELLPSGRSSTDDVAKMLAISKRTLQRYLSSENTSFQIELNKTREKLARHYLSNSSLSGTEIPFLLSFDDPNSFSRAFRSWTGETPKKVRLKTKQAF